MYTIKESSTNSLNKGLLENTCPVSYTLDKIGGRWKPLILFQLNNGPMRYAVLKKSIPFITEKMLIQNLRELEADAIIIREARPVVPPHVTYSLSPAGEALKPMFDAMAAWGNVYGKNEQAPITNS
jgi:DNA-binding HxlR family transcriptional regulator